MNKYKAHITVLKAARSGVKWEKRWADFVEIEQRASEVVDWDAKDMGNDMTFPHSRAEYTGETGNGLRIRTIGHLRRSLGRKGRSSKLYKTLPGGRAHHAVWVPTTMWATKQTRGRRMRKEGQVMWERGSSLNELGTERQGDKETKSGILLFGRKKRFRLVKRLVCWNEEERRCWLVENRFESGSRRSVQNEDRWWRWQ